MIDRLEFTVPLLDLLRGRLVLPEIEVSGPDVLLETARDGTGNWHFGGATDEDGTAIIPRIGAFGIEDAAVGYVDHGRDRRLDAKIASLTGQSVLSLRSTVSVEGRLPDLAVAPDIASPLRLLPPVDLGTAEDAPCKQLIERARQEFD